MLLCKGGRKRGAWTTMAMAMAFLLFLFSSCPPPLRLHRCSSLLQTPGLQNLQVPSTFSCGTCFWGGFCSLGTCFLEIFRRPFPGVQVPIIGFSVPDLQNEVPCVCRSLALCHSLSSSLSLFVPLSRALPLSVSSAFVQIFSHCLASHAKDFASQWTGFKQEKGSKEDSRFKLRREALYCILGTGKKRVEAAQCRGSRAVAAKKLNLQS